jgi:hypothetical protein
MNERMTSRHKDTRTQQMSIECLMHTRHFSELRKLIIEQNKTREQVN